MAIQHPVLKQIDALLNQVEEPILKLFENGRDAEALQEAKRLKEYAATYKAAGGTPTAADWKVIDAQLAARTRLKATPNSTLNALIRGLEQLADGMQREAFDQFGQQLLAAIAQAQQALDQEQRVASQRAAQAAFYDGVMADAGKVNQ